EGSPGGHTVVTVNPSTRAAFMTGGIITAIGGIVDYIGLIVLASSAGGSCASRNSSYSCTQRDPHGGAAAAAGVMPLGGTLAAAAGIVIMLANNSTGVSVAPGSASSASAKPLDAYRREATFHGSSSMPSPTAAAIPFPSFTARF